MPVRSVWVDVAKGAAIALVVFGHCWRGLYNKGLITEGIFHDVDEAIYAFHMPMFFMISGFFFFSRISQGHPLRHMHDITRRLLVPLVLWTYIFLSLRWIFSDFTNARPDITSLFVLPFPGVLHLWFLWALWLIQSALIFLSALFPERLKPRFLLPVALILSLGLWWFLPLMPLQRYVTAACAYAVFFVMGALVYKTLDPVRIGWDVTLVATFGFAGLFWLTGTTGLPSFLAVLLAFGLSVSLLTLLKGLCDHALPGLGILQWIGAFTFSIYMMHTIFSAGIREILLAMGLASLSLHLWAGVIGGIAGPIIVGLIARRYKFDGLLGLSTRLPQRAAL